MGRYPEMLFDWIGPHVPRVQEVDLALINQSIAMSLTPPWIVKPPQSFLPALKWRVLNPSVVLVLIVSSWAYWDALGSG